MRKSMIGIRISLFLTVLVAVMVDFSCAPNLKIPENIISSERNSFQQIDSLQLAWKVRLTTPPMSIVPLTTGQALVTTFRGEVYWLNLSNGKRANRPKQVYRKPVNIVLLDKNSQRLVLSSFLEKETIAYSLTNGKILWKTNLDKVSGNGVIIGEKLFVVRDHHRIVALSSVTGKKVAEIKLKTRILDGLFSDGTNLFSVAEDGVLRTFSDDLKSLGTDSLFLNPRPKVFFGNDRFVIGDSQGRLIGYDFSVGRVVWQKQMSVPIFSEPVEISDRWIVALSDGIVISLDKSGNELWKIRESGMINLPLTAISNYVITPVSPGGVIVLDSETGRKIWQSREVAIWKMTVPTSDGILGVDTKNNLYYWKAEP